MYSDIPFVLVFVIWIVAVAIGLWIQFAIIRAAVLSALTRHHEAINPPRIEPEPDHY